MACVHLRRGWDERDPLKVEFCLECGGLICKKCNGGTEMRGPEPWSPNVDCDRCEGHGIIQRRRTA